MTKKFILLIVFAVSLLSILIIAVWGTLPESANQPSVTDLTFENYEVNDDGDKIINLLGIVTDEDPVYILTYTFLPEDAEIELIVSSTSEDVSVLIDERDQEVVVSFLTEESIGKNVTIRIVDEKTQTSDEITLIFKVPDIITG